MSFRIYAGAIGGGGATLGWSYDFGSDQGAQFCMADPRHAFGSLFVNDQGKMKDAAGRTKYFVTVTSIGVPTDVYLVGGGLT